MMEGWKTWVGVVGFFLTYVATSYLGVDMDAAQSQAGALIELLNAGFGALTVVGVGHKLDKAKIG